MQSRPTFGTYPTFESLEDRRMLAADHPFKDMRVSGTKGDDVMTVTVVNNGTELAPELWLRVMLGDQERKSMKMDNIRRVVINARGGNDSITFDETVSAMRKRVQLMGGRGDDVIYGTPGDDKILAGPGNDLVHGGAGRDMLVGAQGMDSLYGEAGNDKLLGGGDDDLLDGGDDDDRLDGGEGVDSITGGLGNDDFIGEEDTEAEWLDKSAEDDDPVTEVLEPTEEPLTA